MNMVYLSMYIFYVLQLNFLLKDHIRLLLDIICIFYIDLLLL